jgi:hypothetical protein
MTESTADGSGPAGEPRRSVPGRRRLPGPTALLVLYPAAWRRRYGDELDALILEMHADGRRLGWRARADLARAGLRERARGLGGGDPAGRIRGGASLVLWAWALFLLAGAIVAKTSEHWHQALPAQPNHVADAAYAGLTAIALATAIIVVAGIAVTLPAAARFLRAGGWRAVRGRAALAVGLTVVAALATGGLVAWAQRVSPAGRNGSDGIYVAGFVVWAVLGAAALLAWTALATGIARGLHCRPGVLRAQAVIAGLVALAMVGMTAATVAWWVTVAGSSAAALTGGSEVGHATAVVPQLILAAALMVVATGIAALGAARADRALLEL